MNKIYTYKIITDTDKPQLYQEEFWDNVGLHYTVKRKDIGKYMREKAEVDKEYFVFALNEVNLAGFSYYTVSKTENNSLDVIKQIEDKLFVTNSGVYALRKSDFNNDLEKAYRFAEKEMEYLYDLLNTQFTEVRFSAYEYDQEKQKYVKTNAFISEKLIQAHDLEEIMQEKDLTLKEKIIKIVRNENTLDFDRLDTSYSHTSYYFLQDTNSIVMSEKALLEIPQELHPFIDKGLSEREKEFEQENNVEDKSELLHHSLDVINDRGSVIANQFIVNVDNQNREFTVYSEKNPKRYSREFKLSFDYLNGLGQRDGDETTLKITKHKKETIDKKLESYHYWKEDMKKELEQQSEHQIQKRRTMRM